MDIGGQVPSELSFGFHQTDLNVRCWYRDGAWSAPGLVADQSLSLHVAAACLHYGHAVFEGLKAYARPDGRAHVFRPWDHARRMQRSAERLAMEPVPLELFVETVSLAVDANRRFMPAFGSRGSLYLRPFEFGTSHHLEQRPCDEFMFGVYASPVGPFFPGGLEPIDVIVEEEGIRAAPGGTGDVKAAGNYAAGLRALVRARSSGYADVLYLDACEKRFIDELSTTNFFAVRGRTFITPASSSILPSITNATVRQLAAELGMEVEQRPVAVAEIPTFDEVGALGTAAGIVPIGSISFGGERFVYGAGGSRVGPTTIRLHERLVAVQTGTAEDTQGWCYVVPEGGAV